MRESPDQREAIIADLVARHAVAVVRHGPDETIFAQGTRADGLYSIITGHVRVSTRRSGGEATMAYASPLEFFGEVALLSDLLDARTGDLPMSRVFTCPASTTSSSCRHRPGVTPPAAGRRAPRRHNHRAGPAPKGLIAGTAVIAHRAIDPHPFGRGTRTSPGLLNGRASPHRDRQGLTWISLSKR